MMSYALPSAVIHWGKHVTTNEYLLFFSFFSHVRFSCKGKSTLLKVQLNSLRFIPLPCLAPMAWVRLRAERNLFQFNEKPAPGLLSHLSPPEIPVVVQASFFFCYDAQGAKGYLMQMITYLSRWRWDWKWQVQRFLMLGHHRAAFCAPCLLRITLVLLFHLESLFTV